MVETVFAFRLKYFQNMWFECIHRFFRRRKTFTSQFNFDKKYEKIMDCQNSMCFDCSKMFLFWLMFKSFNFRGGEWFAFCNWFFLIFQNTSGKQILVYHPEITVLHCSNEKERWRKIHLFRKKQAIICYEVL